MNPNVYLCRPKAFLMKNAWLALAFAIGLFCGCRQSHREGKKPSAGADIIRHAKGLSIVPFGDFTVVRVTKPWPSAEKTFTYVLAKQGARVPDSLKNFVSVKVPVKRIVATSTTHLPSLELLGVEASLVGFPNLDYISSEKIRALIKAGKVRDLGSNQALDTETVLDLNPDAVIGYGIDNNNRMLGNLSKAGLKIVLNGDWNEQSPLGKAEWIKLFGALYGLEEKAEKIFSDIEKSYLQTRALAQQTATKPTVMAGAMYENTWYLPQGGSWGSIVVADGGGQYVWRDSKGTGSLSLPLETVLEKAHDAEFWIGPGQFTSLDEMRQTNAHYAQFAAFKTGKIYSFSSKKGPTGGILYYEWSTNRPDLVLKDVVKILHPELLPGYELYFFEKLR
jgi:iron complex transport system substrate-binding protein